MSKKQETINMLLDVDNYYGEHEGRLAPVLIFLSVAATPVLLYAYLSFPISAKIFFPIYGVFVIRMALIIIGRERERLVHFKKQLYDVYSSIYELLNIKTIHDDGCVEYVNGKVGYMLVVVNGTVLDDIQRSQMVMEFLTLLGSDYDMDVLVQNITETKALENRYKGVKLFSSPEAAQDFVDIIDHNRKIVYASSLLTRTIFFVKGAKSQWKDIKKNLDMAKFSQQAKAFKEVHIADKDEVVEILSRDVNGTVDLDVMLQKKYATGEYFGSHVVGYDKDKDEKQKAAPPQTLQFIQRFKG
jgi:hypothetical protein